MQLDKTNIVIRERGAGDTLDLTLFVVRHNLGQLLFLLALGVVPFAILNYFCIGWMLDVDRRDYTEMQVTGLAVRHYMWMTALIAVQAPIATAFITRFMGDYVFLGGPPLKRVMKDVLSRLVALLYVQGVLRLGFVVMIMVFFIDRDSESYVAESLAMFAMIGNLLIRAIRPYINELVILERNPFSSKDNNTLTVAVRSSRLHSDDPSAFFRFVIGSVFGVFLSIALINMIYVTIGVLFGDTSFSPIIRHIVVPTACWLSAGFLAVTRFMNYLNRRIENEGWEVELRIKAEASRLFAEGYR